MAAAVSNRRSASRVLRQSKRPRNDQSSESSPNDLLPDQTKSADQRIPYSSDRRLYKLLETLTARVQVLEDRDLAHTHPVRQQNGSQHETIHIPDGNTNRSLYKTLEAVLARVTILESRRDICYRYAFNSADGNRCRVRGCGTISSAPKNALRHLNNTATPEHEVAVEILTQTKCLQCDQEWGRPNNLARHEARIHQETHSSRMDSFKSFIEQPLDSITERQSTLLSPPGSDNLQPQAHTMMRPNWSSFNYLQPPASLTSADAPQQPWQPGPNSLPSVVQPSWSNSNDPQPLADPTFVHGSTQSSSPKLNEFPSSTHDSMHLDSPKHAQLSTVLTTGNNTTPPSQSQFIWAQPQWTNLNVLSDGNHY